MEKKIGFIGVEGQRAIFTDLHSYRRVFHIKEIAIRVPVDFQLIVEDRIYMQGKVWVEVTDPERRILIFPRRIRR